MSERIADRESHRVSLPVEGGEWSLWRCVCLRGAGFPVSEVLRIAAPAAAAAADRLGLAEEEAERLREAALAELGRAIDATAPGARDLLVKAIRKLRQGRPVSPEGLPGGVRAALDPHAEAAAAAGQARADYEAVFAGEEERLARELAQVAGDGRFREAVLWQNRHALKTGIDRLLRQEGAGRRGSKERQHELIVASYLARFATKNDTIGFFGPVGWATLGEAAEPIAVRHDGGFLAARRVFFEGWAVDALAEALARDPGLLIALAPRRGVFVRRDGQVVGLAAGAGPGPAETALLARADGETPAAELARQLVAAGAFPDDAAVYGALERLRAAGLLTWGFELPVILAPEEVLRRRIDRLEGAGAAREAALATLDDLEAHRQGVAAAAGDDRALDAALARLEARFTEVTGQGASRGHGETYAGRTLVYEDCRRGTAVELGAPILAELAAPLSLLLESARWLTWTTAEFHRQLFDETWRELKAETGADRIPLALFCQRSLPTLLTPQTSPAGRQILPEFRRRWAEVLDLEDLSAREVSFTSAELAPRVRAAFAAPRPGWTTARQHCPDLMLAASGPEAIRRGDYRFVMGEIHIATNTVSTHLFVAQHPDPAALFAAMAGDLPEPCVIPTLPKVWQQEQSDALLGVPLPGLTGRLDFGLASAKDVFLEITPAPPGLPSSRILSVAELAVEPGEEGLQVVDRAGSHRFELVEFLQSAISTQILGGFRIFPPRSHRPRVTIDRLIIGREAWLAKAAELTFAGAATPAARFAGARRWAGGLGLPRFLFVKTPYERKPFYLDLESPPALEIFAREVRRTADKSQGKASVTLSEMVPGPDECWLPDADGRCYTSELRMVAVDRAG